MTINALNGPVGSLYRDAIKKLKTGDPVKTSDFNVGRYDSGPSKMSSVLCHIASPSSHTLRTTTGLTVDYGDGTYLGCVLRIDHGTYQWFPHQELSGVDGLVNPTHIQLMHNHKWDVVMTREDSRIDNDEPLGSFSPDSECLFVHIDNKMIVVTTDKMFLCDVVETWTLP